MKLSRFWHHILYTGAGIATLRQKTVTGSGFAIFIKVPMTHLLFLIINLATFLWRPAQGTLNVHDFGAAGDGVTDDTQAINKALQAAHDQQASLYFPSGTYLCNTVDPYNNILTLDAGGTQSLTIYGQDSTSILKTTANQTSVLFYLAAAHQPCSGLTIRNLNFQEAHSAIGTPCNGLFITGTAAQNFTNLQISNCYFQGFTLALCGMGINGWSVTQNFFGAPHGHDDAGNNSNPAVFLWCFDNASGKCVNVSITNNTADGYTGSVPMSALVTHRPMDGFVYGTGYGFTITGNTTRDFCEEQYLLQPKNSNPDDASTTLISNNYLDCSLPAGTANSDGSPHQSNYGIRCDISNATITNNILVNYTFGILVRGVDNPTVKLHSYIITGNQLHAATDPSRYNVSAGILIQGNANPVTNFRLMNNDIYTNIPDQPHSSYSIRIEQTQQMLKSLISNNTVHMIQ